MGRPSSSWVSRSKITAYCLIIISAVIGFSCLEMEAQIVVNSNNGGTLTLDYLLSRDVEGILAANPEAAPYIPLNRADWEGEADRINGLNLLSFTRRDEAKDVAISVRLSFQNNRALEDIFARWGQRLTLIRLGNSTQMNFAPRSLVEDLDLESVTLVKTLFGHYTVAIDIQAPRNIAEDNKNNPGSTQSRWEFDVGEFYDTAFEEWRIVW
jgi:hypothetical protein